MRSRGLARDAYRSALPRNYKIHRSARPWRSLALHQKVFHNGFRTR
ncbi:hypothetical protein PROPHIGD43A-5_62 [Mycobacterium phage prophiGD43A-5]|nr:hypothetical protein PROPHIGD43A-5_62 [Mycobacterium phage prophiGD43A-5]